MVYMRTLLMVNVTIYSIHMHTWILWGMQHLFEHHRDVLTRTPGLNGIDTLELAIC